MCNKTSTFSERRYLVSVDYHFRGRPIDPTVITPTVITPTVNIPTGNPTCCVIARNSSGANREG